MVKMGDKDPCGLVPSRDDVLGSPSSLSDLVKSSENETDPNNDNAAPRSDGCSSRCDNDGNGGCSTKNTSSRNHHHMPSFPTSTQLMSEFTIAADAEGSGSSSSSSSSGALDLEGVIHLATPVATDTTIIMEGELLDVDDEPANPSSTKCSASLIDNNEWGTSSGARHATIDNNKVPMVSSASQGSSGGGSGGRRSASNDQFPWMDGHRRMYVPRNNGQYEVGSSSREPASRQWQRVSPPKIQIQPHEDPEFSYLYNFRLPSGLCIPPNMNFPRPPPPWVRPGSATGLRVQLRSPVHRPMYLYGSPGLRTYPPFEVTTVVPARRSSGLYPPPGVTIRHPPTSSGDPPLLQEQPVRTRVTIKAPPASERASLSEPKQPEATLPAQKPEQLEASPSRSVSMACVPTVWWPPTAEEDTLYTARLYGPSHRPRRLPVFEDICRDMEPSQPYPPSQRPPLPPPPPSSPPPSPPPPSQPPFSPTGSP